MDNGIKIFRNEEFGEIRTMSDEKEGTPLFCFKDVCDALGYVNNRNALKRHVEEGDVLKRYTPTVSGEQEMAYVNESGLYALMLGSKLEKAKRFRHWVTSEVLPSIRKSGAYMTEEVMERAITDPDFLIRLATTLKEEKSKYLIVEEKCNEQHQVIEQQHDQLSQKDTQIHGLENEVVGLQKKVSYLDLILASTSTVTVSQIAADYGMSAIKMNRLLKEMGIQYKLGDQWLLYAKYKDKGYVSSETVYFELSDGTPMTKMNTKWTQEGRLFLYDILKKVGILPMLEQKQLDFSNKYSA